MRPIFVGGCPRSGTTLLGGLLGAHSRCLCLPEMQFKLPLFRDADWSAGRISVEELVRRIGRSWRLQVWDVDLEPGRFRNLREGAPGAAAARDSVTYREAIEGIVRVYAAETEQPEPEVWLDHTPGNVRQGNMLFDQFPEARLIHLVRDGRAVASSVAPLLWGPNTVWDATDWWPEWLGYGLALEARHPERVARVHFEELVRSPRDVLRRLCRFLGLEEERHLGTATDFRVPRFTRGQHERVSRPPDPDRAEAWKGALSRRQIELFESSAGELLTSLGYALEFGGRARRPTRFEKLKMKVGGLARAGSNRIRLRWRIRRFAGPAADGAAPPRDAGS